jgi:hypothetical protein
MNHTADDITNINWATRSPSLAFTDEEKPLLLFSAGIGIFMIIHSWIINGFRYKRVQIISELASITMVGSAACFLSCLNDDCSLVTHTVVNNILANCFFGLICQSCDNYLTFERYNRIVGKTTSLHKNTAFTYWVVLLFLTWYPFYTVLPVWYDQNSELWVFIGGTVFNYTNFAAYVFYNMYYLVSVCLEIRRMNSAKLSSNNLYLTEIAIRSVCHTVFSTVGIILYVFHLPAGSLEQTICISGSIHIFLNWKFNVNKIVGFLRNSEITAVYRIHNSTDNRSHATEPAETTVSPAVVDEKKVGVMKKSVSFENHVLPFSDTGQAAAVSEKKLLFQKSPDLLMRQIFPRRLPPINMTVEDVFTNSKV